MIFNRMEHSLAIPRKVMLQDPEQLEVMAQQRLSRDKRWL